MPAGPGKVPEEMCSEQRGRLKRLRLLVGLGAEAFQDASKAWGRIMEGVPGVPSVLEGHRVWCLEQQMRPTERLGQITKALLAGTAGCLSTSIFPFSFKAE